MGPYIVFDVGKVQQLKAEFDASLTFTRSLLPPINWNSQKQIIGYFEREFGIILENTRIKTIAGQQSVYAQDPDLFDLFTGLLQYLKLKAILVNYIHCILKHLDGDCLYLREVDGVWKMPNKQPLPEHSEIISCIKRFSAELIPHFSSLTRP
jgi:hypothetical protein